MAILRDQPYPDFNFLVDLGDGVTEGPQGGFKEVILPEMSVGVIEYRTGNDKENSVRKLPGLERTGNLVLRRGFLGSLNLYAWYNQVRNGDPNARRNVLIHLQNEDHTAIVVTWKVLRAWPVKYSFSTLNATSNDVVIEELELACERVEME